jgi:ornithine carbamoyltransferase
VLSAYVDAIAVRTFAQADVEQLAAAASVPVINALTDEHHLCQALADLLTIKERFGRLEGLKLAYVGAGNNVAHSLLEAGAMFGMDVVLANPSGCHPHAEILIEGHAAAEQHGGTVDVVAEPGTAVRGAQVVYTDDVIDGPSSIVFQQAANRLPTEQALIHTLLHGWNRCA